MPDNSNVISARTNATDLVTVKIVLNGQPMNGEYRILGLNIFKSFNKVASANISIADGDVAKQDFVISSTADDMKPGSEIEIALGYHARTEIVFKGVIVRHSIKAGKNRSSMLTIEAKDKAVKLTLNRKSHCYVDKKDSEIITEIVQQSGYGGTSDVETTNVAHKEMVQYNSLDWDFIVSRAEMNGLLVLTNNNKLIVKKPDTSKAPVKEITFGIDILEFESELDGLSQLPEVKSQAWNYQDNKLEEESNTSLSFKETGNLSGKSLADALKVDSCKQVHTGNLNNTELKTWSEAKLLKSLLAKTVGYLKVQGTTEIVPGDVIQLKGFSKRFNGNVLVTAIAHNYTSSIWETNIQFGLPEPWFYQKNETIDKPAAGLIPGINGLHIGIVVKNESDPDKQDRVKVQIPLVDQGEGIWARISSLDAGKDRGAFFRPEVGDEVVVGFMNDDPRYPVILGMLNSGKNPAPFPGSDANHEKGFVTRSKMKMVFNDEKKSLIIETPGGKKVEVNEDSDTMLLTDQHNNKILMDASGIKMESVKVIFLKAPAGNINMEAMNIDQKATAQFKAAGTAGATLQSSGVTIVKGSMVNIN